MWVLGGTGKGRLSQSVLNVSIQGSRKAVVSSGELAAASQRTSITSHDDGGPMREAEEGEGQVLQMSPPGPEPLGTVTMRPCTRGAQADIPGVTEVSGEGGGMEVTGRERDAGK